ncbi:MAG TPA: protein kinase [Gemmatimonadaceae bacterium]
MEWPSTLKHALARRSLDSDLDDATLLKSALASRYEIDRELGRGGMATVYLARDIKHSRVVAIKVLKREMSADVDADRFHREISIAAQLRHPHILTLIDSGEANGLLYYVMPFVDGESLRSRITREGALPISETTRILREVVDALAHAHKHGMIHRDIKPANVMIGDRHALVLDFGVAKATSEGMDDPLTGTGVLVGTPEYMAPEYVLKGKADQRADIYAVGLLAYEMIAGRPPFSGNPRQIVSAHVMTTPEELSRVQSLCPPELSRIVMKCLEKEPGDRYQTAEDLLAALEALSTPGETSAGSMRARAATTKRRYLKFAAAAAVLFMVGAVYALTSRNRRERWAKDEAIPRIQRFIESESNDSALIVANQAALVLPNDSVLNSLWGKFSERAIIRTKPAGAKAYRALFTDTTHWELIGTTPTDSVRIALWPSLTRLRFVKPGFRTVEEFVYEPPSDSIVLDSVSALSQDMVRIPGGDLEGGLPGLASRKPIALGDFFVDKHEVTNSQYKAFVDAGGYMKKEYWDGPFEKDGRTISWDQAMALFIDNTGRPGPATWEAGDFPADQADFPVAGVSWYEAAAYAKFSGKMLPTLYHWERAAATWASPFIVPTSNFSGKGPLPAVGSRGMSAWGVYDMPGNVREWCWNAAGKNRYVLGGGWSDQPYSFEDAYTQLPMDRSVINGIRLVRYTHEEPNLRLAMEPVMQDYRDYSVEKPVSDAIFASYLRMYDYDRTPLHAKVEAIDTSEFWIRQKISFAAAYGSELVVAYLFLPRHGRPPYQTLVYFPGSNALAARSSNDLIGTDLDFVLKTGRAVMYPIYKSTYERGDSLKTDYPAETIFYRDHVIMWAKDMRRSIDYLETRPDIDPRKVAYYGVSWGGQMGGIMPAVEPRLKVVLLYIAGLPMERARPEADVINFLPHVTAPVILMDGKYDSFFPVETSQKPFFRLLGSRPDQKRHVVSEGGHGMPHPQLIKESLAWLDKYLGPLN